MPSYNLPKEVEQLVNDAISTVDFDPHDKNAYMKLYRQTETRWPFMGRRARANRVKKAMKYLEGLDLEATRKRKGII